MADTNLLQLLNYSVLQQCMHCGLCLPTCPTYDETRRERSSPRGRIRLMRDVADGRLEVGTTFADEMSYCLGCLACQSACPAGVDYATLLERARGEAERQNVRRGLGRWLLRGVMMGQILRRPRLLRAFGRLVWLYERSGLQSTLRRSEIMRAIVPRVAWQWDAQAPDVRPPFSHKRIRRRESTDEAKYCVGLLTGCVQDLALARINRATADVLLANDCEVVTPAWQYCCGSLHAHNGELEWARDLARRNIDSFDLDEVDAIITNSGGCGSHLRRYGELLHDDPVYAAEAQSWDRKVRDIHEWLVDIDFRDPRRNPGAPEQVVTYDASCHLLHGQRVAHQPLEILRAIPGVRLVALAEADWCCGSAGIYSLTQPEQSAKLLDRKLDKIAATGATVLATGNPGCLLQIERGARSDPRLQGLRVCHPIELLAEAYQAEQGAGA
jgi:glycolate oxidase iron-sulfur subunit